MKKVKIKNEDGVEEELDIDDNYYVLYKVMKELLGKLRENK